MSLPADYHMHTPLCRHARGEPEEYVRRALELGFEEIGFSDHAPMPQDDFDNWRMNADKLDEYVAKVCKVQKDFPQLTIRLALEVDYLPATKTGFAISPRGIHGIISSVRCIMFPSRGPLMTRKNCPNGSIATPMKSGPSISSG